MITLPKNPKLSDLAAAITALDGRLDTLEARVDDLARWRDQHELSRVARQRQVDGALDELRRMRRSSPT